MVNIGVGYTLPFKVVGAPWIDAEKFAEHLNAQHFPGVRFKPFHYRPFYGRFAKEDCHGVLIVVEDSETFRPVATQYLIIGILKSLYPKQFETALNKSQHRRKMFAKVNGTDEIWKTIQDEKYIVWKLKKFDEEKRQKFKKTRKRYLIADYQ